MEDQVSEIFAKPTDFVPATFLERGVAIDFTTPILAQARIRPGQDGRVEVIVPNIGGGRGYYILQWRSLLSFAQVTLHDHRLQELVGALDVVHPSTVRSAVLRAASEGLAGRDARQRAIELRRREHDDEVLANVLLVTRLLERAGVSIAGLLKVHGARANLEQEIRTALARISDRLGAPAEALYDRLEMLSRLYAPLGLPWSPEAGRLRRLMADLASFQADLKAWSRNAVPEMATLAGFVATVALHTAELAAIAINDADTIIADVGALLRSWTENRALAGDRVSRVAWLLDGWAHIIASWRAVADGSYGQQVEALAELGRFVPIMPREALKWTDTDLPDEARGLQRRWVKMHQDWRTGRMYGELVRRNEEIKAVAS